MAAHSSALAWKIPWMEEPGGLQSMGSLRVGHDRNDLAAAAAALAVMCLNHSLCSFDIYTCQKIWMGCDMGWKETEYFKRG